MEKKANYDVRASVQDEVLEITLKGEFTKDTFENVTKEINAAIKSSGARRAIADIRAVEKRLDDSDIYRYLRMYDIVLFDIQYAIVDLPQNTTFRNAATEAGISSSAWFTNMDTARQWFKRTREPDAITSPAPGPLYKNR